MTPDRYTLTIAAARDPLARRCERPRPVEVRLRALLKHVVRVARFRVLSVRPDHPADSPLPPTPAAQNASGSTISHTDPQ